MKRSYSEMSTSLSVLVIPNNDPKWFKATLEGLHRLYITKVADISKPVDKPIEDIDEPEEEDIAMQNKLSKSNARMIQLELKDLKDTSIKAIETEFIELLNDVKPGNIINLSGPAEIRCGNIMLEKKHVINVEREVKEEAKVVQEPQERVQIIEEKKQDVINLEDWDDEDEDDCIILD